MKKFWVAVSSFFLALAVFAAEAPGFSAKIIPTKAVNIEDQFAGILPGLVSGSILIEYIFNIPGMGALSMLALSSRDIPLLMTLFAFSGFLTLAGILLSDILYVIADPRIGFESRV